LTQAQEEGKFTRELAGLAEAGLVTTISDGVDRN
jgi:hypothetical protein